MRACVLDILYICDICDSMSCYCTPVGVVLARWTISCDCSIRLDNESVFVDNESVFVSRFPYGLEYANSHTLWIPCGLVVLDFQ